PRPTSGAVTERSHQHFSEPDALLWCQLPDHRGEVLDEGRVALEWRVAGANPGTNGGTVLCKSFRLATYNRVPLRSGRRGRKFKSYHPDLKSKQLVAFNCGGLFFV
ncbi:MAG: hypothetical protein V3T49_08615, partial [Dehalococcoidia bacterium]